jgi:hypothetical protein
MSKCPGQNTQYWGFDAIYDVACPNCSKFVEFFRDEVRRRCNSCGEMVFNDRIDLGCAKWCPAASSCIGAENFKTLELSEKRKSRREDLLLLLEGIPEDETAVRELFKKLYSEYNGEDRLFDTNRLYSVQEQDPDVFDAAIGGFQLFLSRKSEAARKEQDTAARTQELLDRRLQKKSSSAGNL